MIHSFPSGTLALDLLGTRRKRRNDHPTEKLQTRADLDAWLTESGMLTEPPGPDAPHADATDLADAIRLREAVYRLMRARIEGAPLPDDAVALVNDVAAGAPLAIRLTDAGAHTYGTARQAQSTLAREAIAIAAGPDAALLRECARPECTQLYLDRSRGHRREWCSMATCGNRMKAAAYRARQRA